ncbi:MAG: hypothetical protein K6F72_01855 [Bacteroidales bacterium]|jgi:hypothetical protein|nr:hypothetical protein [Bacteroidales bacterium]
MKNNDDILEILEQHWERMDEIAEQSHVSVVRWHLPESPRRWVRSIAASVAAIAIGAALLLTKVPQPDGLYASNLSHRSEAIEAINEISMSIL